MRDIDINLNNILLDENSYKNILVYNISNKIVMGEKPLWIEFDKTDRFIKTYNGIGLSSINIV